MASDRKTRHLEIKAVGIEPVDADGVNCFIVGTLACLIVCLVLHSCDAPAWQMHSALAGLLIGGFGLAYCVLRKR